MAATKQDWELLLAQFIIQDGKVAPVATSLLYQYEHNSGFALPQSYRDYCATFGPGELRHANTCEIHVPYAVMPQYNIDQLNDSMQHVAITGIADVDLFLRAVFFGSNMDSDCFFWDPLDIRQSTTSEYSIYVLRRNQTIEKICESFWAFINHYCIGPEAADREYIFSPKY